MPLMRSEDGRQRIVPTHSVGKYERRGWSTGDESTAVDVPNESDLKGDWVAYAQTRGYDPVEGLTKDELIERYG